jgi:hypothetical protein
MYTYILERSFHLLALLCYLGFFFFFFFFLTILRFEFCKNIHIFWKGSLCEEEEDFCLFCVVKKFV